MSFSAHADSKGIMELLSHLEPKNVILVHGEKEKMRKRGQRLGDRRETRGSREGQHNAHGQAQHEETGWRGVSERAGVSWGRSLAGNEPRPKIKLVLEKFSQTVSDYTSCVASFARPIELCLRCRDKYVSVGTAYDYMEDFAQDNYTCKEVLTKQDRLNVIGKMYESVIGSDSMWQLASCNSKLCFIRF